ncbi:MAG: hypothetical protein K2X47_16720 [Bdellovibrionales bacterium]|nr:hypothetical protein [Bdellovibrionales bacterium]
MRRPSSPKTFGIFFCAIFAGCSIFAKDLEIIGRLLLGLSGMTLGFLAVFKPSTLEKPNLLWYKFGLLLQKIISPILMGLFFFFLFTPLAVLLRLFGSRFLEIETDSKRDSYWIVRDAKLPASQSLRKQF